MAETPVAAPALAAAAARSGPAAPATATAVAEGAVASAGQHAAAGCSGEASRQGIAAMPFPNSIPITAGPRVCSDEVAAAAAGVAPDLEEGKCMYPTLSPEDEECTDLFALSADDEAAAAGAGCDLAVVVRRAANATLMQDYADLLMRIPFVWTLVLLRQVALLPITAACACSSLRFPRIHAGCMRGLD